MSAKNFPYERPQTMWEAFNRPIDRYRANYDSVFFPAKKLKFEYLGELFGMKVFIDRDLPADAPVFMVHSDFLKAKTIT